MIDANAVIDDCISLYALRYKKMGRPDVIKTSCFVVILCSKSMQLAA